MAWPPASLVIALLLCTWPCHGVRVSGDGMREVQVHEAPDPETAALLGLHGKLLPEVLRLVLAIAPQPRWVAWSIGDSAGVSSGVDEPTRISIDDATDLKFLPVGGRLLTLSNDGRCKVWCAWTGVLLYRLREGHAAGTRIFETQVFPDGERVVTIGSDKQAIIWSVTSGRAVPHTYLRGIGNHRAVRVLPCGDRLVTGSTSRTWGEIPAVWSDKGVVLHRLRHPPGNTRCLEVSPCGKFVASAVSNSIFVWKTEGSAFIRELTTRMMWISGLAITEGGRQVVVCSLSGRTIVWRGLDSEHASSYAWPPAAGIVAFTIRPRGDRLVAITHKGNAVWELSSGQMVLRLKGEDEHWHSVAALDHYVAACSSRGGSAVVLWDARTGAQLFKETGNRTSRVEDLPCVVALAPSGSLLSALPGF